MTLAAYDGTNAPTLKLQFYKSGAWTTVSSSDVREIFLTRGKFRADQDITPGQMIVTLDNFSGDYDPDNTSGTWVVSSKSIIKDGLPVQLIFTWSAVDYTLFAGFMETVEMDYGFDPTATFTVVDALAIVARVEMPALNDYYHQGETTSTRVSRILGNVSLSPFTHYQSGSVAMIETTEGKNALQLIRECVDAQAGQFYARKDGSLTLLDLNDKFTRPTQLTFNDDRTYSNAVEYDVIKTTPGTLQVVNKAIITRGKYSQKVATNDASITSWGIRALTKECLVQSDAVGHKLAVYYAKKDSDPTTTVAQVQFEAIALGALFPDFLTLELQDMVRVIRTTPGANVTRTMNCVVEGLDYHITPDSWRATYYCSPMNSYKVVL